MAMTKLKVIPMPKSVYGEDENGGFSRLSVPACIRTDDSRFGVYTESFRDYIRRMHGVDLSLDADGGIVLSTDMTLAPGEYRIDSTAAPVSVCAADDDGANYALSVLAQLLSAENGALSLPAVRITDRPDCPFRALMVDLARKWHPFNTLFEYVDLCWLYRVKYLHLHFVDTQLYTLPSDLFPNAPTPGAHYTKEQLRELNEYARARGIELIPEMEVPGHAAAMIRAYPDLFGNTLVDFTGEAEEITGPKIEASTNIICAGKPGVMDTLRRMTEEIIEMFPYSRYLHIGGDEAAIFVWDSCTDCRRYMEENGISGSHALYSDFVRRMTDMVLELGKTPIVWEGFPREGTEAISRDVVVVAWESYYHLAPDLIEEGFDIINASWQPNYITPTLRWKPEDILAWDVHSWYHWWKKSEAHLNPIHIPKTNQMLGGLLCAWECTYEEEIEAVRENLAALSERTWNIRRYAEDEEFREKLNHILPLTLAFVQK